jgi:hypothetical protein
VRTVDDEARQRAAALRARISAAGVTIAQFQRKSGLSRNVVYCLAKGQMPKPDQQAKVDAALGATSVRCQGRVP